MLTREHLAKRKIIKPKNYKDQSSRGGLEVERWIATRVRILPFLGPERIVFLSITRIDGYIMAINVTEGEMYWTTTERLFWGF